VYIQLIGKMLKQQRDKELSPSSLTDGAEKAQTFKAASFGLWWVATS